MTTAPIITEFRFDDRGSLIDPEDGSTASIDLRVDPDPFDPEHLVTLSSGDTVTVVGANAYQPEGPMTTFFATGSGRGTIDSWSIRVASYRTADIVSIRRAPASDSAWRAPTLLAV